MSETTDAPVETMEFKSELRQILQIITHSLYSHKEIFVRELISNASDAINKVRFDSLNNEELLGDDKDWKIKLTADKEKGTLTISDNGIGMSRDTVIDQLGTIAKSGTKEFLETLKQADSASKPEMIGQFGVGFYSAFMVADRVTVLSRQVGDAPDQAIRWVSAGEGEYTLKTQEKDSRGTDVILHLKEDEKEFLDEWRLRQVVKQFSDFIEYPVVMDVEKEVEGEKKIEEETLNSMKAIWLRSKSEVSDEEYGAFYKQISSDFNEPGKVIHYTAEGLTEFKVLLFIPSKRPFDLMFGEPKIGPKLYVQRVLIMDNCEELLPAYLRFVKGVVDCPDLPLNVSRELLQHNPVLDRIRKNVVKRVFQALTEMMKDDYEAYVGFYSELGLILKEGISQDHENQEQIADLLLFEAISTEPGKHTTLEAYIENMPADQEEIYFLTGENRTMLEHTPYLEVFRDKDWDVLFLTDPIDEFVIPSLTEYKGKKLKPVDKAEVEADEVTKVNAEEHEKTYKTFIEMLKEKITEVQDVRLTTRLKESASCLVSDEGMPGANMERIMQRMGQTDGMPTGQRILELNPEHPAVEGLQKLFDSNPEDERIESFSRLLYEEAVIAEGSKLNDPVGFARRVNELLLKSLA